MDFGVVLVAPGWRVLAVNHTARLYLQAGDGLTLSDGSLKLPGLLGSPEGVTRLERPSGKPAWVVWVTPLQNGSPGDAYRAALIFDPSNCSSLRMEVCREAFHLTNAEARLAERLLAGETPTEAAESLHVTIHTVRTYLKRLYSKLGVRTLAALVRALMQAGLSVPVQAPKQ